jgi:hypothetical protein
MKTLSIVKAALGGGAAILLGGLLAAAPAQASTGRTVPCKTQALIAAINAANSSSPATSLRRSRPFPSGERVFCASGTVVKRLLEPRSVPPGSETGRHGRDSLDVVDAAPAISGCLAQRYRKCIPVSSIRAGLAGTCGAEG